MNLARPVKDAQAEEKCCYHYSILEHFICNCPLIKTLRENAQLNGKEGDGVKEGSLDPSGNGQYPKEPPDGGSQGVKPPPQTPFLNPDPFQC